MLFRSIDFYQYKITPISTKNVTCFRYIQYQSCFFEILKSVIGLSLKHHTTVLTVLSLQLMFTCRGVKLSSVADIMRGVVWLSFWHQKHNSFNKMPFPSITVNRLYWCFWQNVQPGHLKTFSPVKITQISCCVRLTIFSFLHLIYRLLYVCLCVFSLCFFENHLLFHVSECNKITKLFQQ